MLRNLLGILLIFGLFSCASPKKDTRTARTKDAQERINSSKVGADEITKELDN